MKKSQQEVLELKQGFKNPKPCLGFLNPCLKLQQQVPNVWTTTRQVTHDDHNGDHDEDHGHQS